MFWMLIRGFWRKEDWAVEVITTHLPVFSIGKIVALLVPWRRVLGRILERRNGWPALPPRSRIDVRCEVDARLPTGRCHPVVLFRHRIESLIALTTVYSLIMLSFVFEELNLAVFFDYRRLSTKLLLILVLILVVNLNVYLRVRLNPTLHRMPVLASFKVDLRVIIVITGYLAVHHPFHNNLWFSALLLLRCYDVFYIEVTLSLLHLWTLTLSDDAVVAWQLLLCGAFHFSWILCLAKSHLTVTARAWSLLHRMERSQARCVILHTDGLRWHELHCLVLGRCVVVSLAQSCEAGDSLLVAHRLVRQRVSPILALNDASVAASVSHFLCWENRGWTVDYSARRDLSEHHGQARVRIVLYHQVYRLFTTIDRVGRSSVALTCAFLVA